MRKSKEPKKETIHSVSWETETSGGKAEVLCRWYLDTAINYMSGREVRIAVGSCDAQVSFQLC